VYSVYVIELTKGVLEEATFRKANPRHRPGAPCVYVGCTAKAPELRFEQHKNGYRSARFARKYGERLMPDLYERYNPIPNRKEAEELERYLAERLRSQGYGVWTN